MANSVDAPEPPVEDAGPGSPFVVGLGASAGGIQALKHFFAHVEPGNGVAYVVILHLSPDHDSHLAEVLQTTAPMPVAQVMASTPIVADHVYVVPPNRSLSITGGSLTVSEFTRSEERRSPVDLFFRALADTHGARSACVVLSGTGLNGSAGLKRVKEYGGLVLAQEPDEAEYGDMPRNAIATGLVDLVLPIAEMPAKIGAYVERLRTDDTGTSPAEAVGDPDALRDVLTLLRVRTGHDFSNYKAPTLQRRLDRRMSVRGVESLGGYARLIRREPDEAIALMKELLISVTSFFRDHTAWGVFEQRVVPRLFFNKEAQDQVRVWVPGCATGEEAYSVAMLLAEYGMREVDQPSIQVFATDLDQRAIDTARDGLYSESDVADVSEERVHRFFQRDARGFHVRRELRELILFASHNVIKDPPFSHLDLICCRNLLIYLNRQVQERVIETFHFALRPGGYLFLGGSESPDSASDLFLRFDGPAHIYESRSVTSPLTLHQIDTPAVVPHAQSRAAESRGADRISPAELHQRLIEQYAPPSVVVTEERNVVHLSDRVGRYMELRGGELTRDLLLLVRPELRPDLRTALHQAATDRAVVDVLGVAVHIDGKTSRVHISVKPVVNPRDSARGYFVVTFDEESSTAKPQGKAVTLTSPVEPVAQQLEEELARVKAQLRTTVEQYETQVEEAKASFEELQAMNEELRSAAEELETSKEELQSVNEELTTVNQELKIKIEELGLTNNDFQNFINATDIGTIFLDRALRVKFSTPRAREVFNLLDTDIGRPLSDITSKLLYPGIHADVRAVLERLSSFEREVQTEDQRWHLMRLLPYRTSENHIDGVVITFHDITERRLAEQRVRVGEERLRLLIDSALDYAIFSTTENGIIDSWNAGAQRMFGYTADEIVGSGIEVLFTPEDRAAGVHVREQAEARRSGRVAYERYHVRKDGGRLYSSGVMHRLGSGGMGFANIARDLTAQRQSAEALQAVHDQFETRLGERTRDLEDAVREQEAGKDAVTGLVRRLVTAQEDERHRIARDLHDHFGQQLTALRQMLERVKEARGDGDPASADVDRALETTSQIGRDVDFLAWELRPAALDELGLAAALPRFVKEWSAHTGLPVEFRSGGFDKGQLPREAEVAFYRIAQEALNNVLKHAHASRVDMVLSATDGQVVLVVEDDGIGFDPADSLGKSDGIGLASMRERAVLVGGVVQIESEPGKGTSVYVRRPSGAIGAAKDVVRS